MAYLCRSLGDIETVNAEDLRIKIVAVGNRPSTLHNWVVSVNYDHLECRIGKFKGKKQHIVEIIPLYPFEKTMIVPYVIHSRIVPPSRGMEGYRMVLAFSHYSIWREFESAIRYYHKIMSNEITPFEVSSIFDSVVSLYIQRLSMDNYSYPKLSQATETALEKQVLLTEKIRNHVLEYMTNRQEAMSALRVFKKNVKKIMEGLCPKIQL